jgi:hypothetical protein
VTLSRRESASWILLPRRRFGRPLGLPRTRRGRCFSPTSATDLLREHPWIVVFSSSRRLRVEDRGRARSVSRPRRVPPHVAGLPRGGPAPSGRALDGALPTSAASHRALPPEGNVLGRVIRVARPRRCRPCAQLETRPLAPSVAPRSRSGLPEGLEAPQPPRRGGDRPTDAFASIEKDRFVCEVVKPRSIPGPGRLPSTSCPSKARLSPRDFDEGPATVRPALPPSAGFRRSFAPRACAEVARPRNGSSGSSPLGARGQTPLVDFCNRSDPRAPPRTVRTSPTPRTVTRARSS